MQQGAGGVCRGRWRCGNYIRVWVGGARAKGVHGGWGVQGQVALR